MPYPIPGYPRLVTSRPQGSNLDAGQVDIGDVNASLLSDLELVAESLGKTLTIFSGYRTDAYSASHGGFAGDPHTQGIAADVTVDGSPLGQYPGAMQAISSAGLVSGNQPNFYHGAPDPAHVQLSTSAQQPGTQDFVGELESKVPSLDPWVLRTWILEEGGPADNPLNIGPGAHYGTPVAAADATAQVLLHSPAAYGYGSITSAKTVGDQISAIVSSKWDKTHYAKGGGVAGFDKAFQGLEKTYGFGYLGLDRPVQTGSSQGGGDTGPGDSSGLLGGIAGSFQSITDAFKFIFSYRFLEILGGGLLLLMGLYLLSKQFGVSLPKTPAQTAANSVSDAV